MPLGGMQVGKGKGYSAACTANAMPSQCDFGLLYLCRLWFAYQKRKLAVIKAYY